MEGEPPALKFQFVRSSQPSAASRLLGTSSPRFQNIPEGGRLEVSAVSFRHARKLAELISSGFSGSGLVIDYGGNHAFGSSLRVCFSLVLRMKTY